MCGQATQEWREILHLPGITRSCCLERRMDSQAGVPAGHTVGANSKGSSWASGILTGGLQGAEAEERLAAMAAVTWEVGWL